jgi:hypothetical protein
MANHGLNSNRDLNRDQKNDHDPPPHASTDLKTAVRAAPHQHREVTMLYALATIIFIATLAILYVNRNHDWNDGI